MKVPVTDLVRLIREVVQDEVKKQLPEMVREALAEGYLRRLVAEQAGRRPKLAEAIEDEIPEPENPVADDHEGIYHPANPKVQTDEVTQKLLSRDQNPLAFLYENVKPIHAGSASTKEDAPPVEAMAAAGFDFAKMKKLAALPSASTKPMTHPNSKLREIEERRKALDVPVDQFKG